MRVVALDTHDGHYEGEVYEVSEPQARKLIAKGLVKMGPIPENKMAPPLDNKENPLPAAGAVAIASLSPAAPACPNPIASASGNGAPRRRGRPPKVQGEPSP